MSRAVAARTLSGTNTVFAKVRGSVVPDAIYNSAFRRLSRNTANFQKKFPDYKPDLLTQKMAVSKLSAAPPALYSPVASMKQQTTLQVSLPATNTFFTWGLSSNLSAKNRLNMDSQGLGDLEKNDDKTVIKGAM